MSKENECGKEGIGIRVPATTANLGAAFDSVGVALQLYLRMEVRRLDGEASRLEFNGEGEECIPRDASNLIWRVMLGVAEKRQRQLPPFSLRIDNEIPITKGLGSSATACVAAVAAADFLCRLDLESRDIVALAVGEEGHPDNVAPAVFGGIVASMSDGAILCSRSDFPASWTIVAVTPDLELTTRQARSVLPACVSMTDAVFNVQRAAFLMAQVVQGRREGIRQAMADRLHQPYRRSLVPGLDEILGMKDRDGLIGVALSGSGSTVVAIVDSHAEEIGTDMCRTFARHGLQARPRFLKADNEGLVIKNLTEGSTQ